MRAWLVTFALLTVGLSGCSGADDGGTDGGMDDGTASSTGASSTTSSSSAAATTSTSSTTSSMEERRAPVTWVVTMEGVAFHDSPATIQRGDTVRWVHEDGATTHRVETRDGAPEAFDSGDMTGATGSGFEFTFETVGEYEYFCRYHEGAMGESIEVRQTYDGTPDDPRGQDDGGTEDGNATPDPNQTGEPRDPVTWEIRIAGTAFVDGTLTVQKGDTVRWVHADGAAPHTVTADGGEFGSGPVYMVEAPGLDTYEFTFDGLGTFPYHCEVHPSMQQTITVVEVYQATPDETPPMAA